VSTSQFRGLVVVALAAVSILWRWVIWGQTFAEAAFGLFVTLMDLAQMVVVCGAGFGAGWLVHQRTSSRPAAVVAGVVAFFVALEVTIALVGLLPGLEDELARRQALHDLYAGDEPDPW